MEECEKLEKLGYLPNYRPDNVIEDADVIRTCHSANKGLLKIKLQPLKI